MTVDPRELLILGAGGQLGTALRSRYPQARALRSAGLDIGDADAVSGFDWSGIRTVINAAAYTAVDAAETAAGRAAAWQVNAVGARNLAGAAVRNDFTLVHVSTDYVFDGTREPHLEDEQLTPLGVYGQSKAAGDVVVGLVPQHFLLRTSWVIGEGNNFVRTMLTLGHKGVSPNVVADQSGRLSFTDEIARAIDHLLRTGADYGTYNVSNAGAVSSWADVARAVFTLAGHGSRVVEVTSADYFAGQPAAAPRPMHSAFDLGKLRATGFEPTDWYNELEGYVVKELAH